MSLVENTSEGVGGCDGSICIKWPGFSTHIEDLMAQLWRDEAETDVHVVCQDGTVKVHAIIIALFSPSMAEMLKTCQVQDDHGVTILMPDFHLQDLTKFFYLLYHHHTELVASDASVLSEIASCLTMDLSLSGPFGDHLVSSKPLRKSKVEDDPGTCIGIQCKLHESEDMKILCRVCGSEVPLKENCLNQDDEKEAFKPLKKRKKCSNGAKKKFPDGAQRKRRLKVSNKDKARQSPVEEVALDDTLENAMLKISTEDLQEKDTVATEDENKIPEDEGSMDFKCPKCGKTLKACTKQRMEQHLRTHEAKNRLYTCDDCPRTFSHASVLRDHKRVHSGEGPYTCETCGRQFTQVSGFRKHQKHHQGKFPFTCDACGKGFLHLSLLEIHKRSHTGERPFTCEVCGKSFIYAGDLERHRKIFHTGEHRFYCEFCGRGFGYKFKLAEHRRIHTGECPYQCDKCGKRFKRAADYEGHKNSHTGERPHGCEICGKYYSRPEHLRRHRRKVHVDMRRLGIPGRKPAYKIAQEKAAATLATIDKTLLTVQMDSPVEKISVPQMSTPKFISIDDKLPILMEKFDIPSVTVIESTDGKILTDLQSSMELPLHSVPTIIPVSTVQRTELNPVVMVTTDASCENGSRLSFQGMYPYTYQLDK